MISKWMNQKPKAISLRRKGNSIGNIEKTLGIPRSTLSSWLRVVPLTEKQKNRLRLRAEQGLATARVAAVQWHNAQKKERLERAAAMGERVLSHISKDAATIELALAFLYLGEGAKTRDRTVLGSSDPRIARFFVQCLREIYRVPVQNIRCYLHLRADQNPQVLRRYWSRKLNLLPTNFGKASVDKRTKGKPTYPYYKGVCQITCGRVEIQRRLMYIANGFCDTTSRTHANRAVSSVGRASA